MFFSRVTWVRSWHAFYPTFGRFPVSPRTRLLILCVDIAPWPQEGSDNKEQYTTTSRWSTYVQSVQHVVYDTACNRTSREKTNRHPTGTSIVSLSSCASHGKLSDYSHEELSDFSYELLDLSHEELSDPSHEELSDC